LGCGDRKIAVRLRFDVAAYLAPRGLTLVGAHGTHRAYLTPMSDRPVVQALSVAGVDSAAAVAHEDWLSVDWNGTD
jgi:putative hemin transport protein